MPPQSTKRGGRGGRGGESRQQQGGSGGGGGGGGDFRPEPRKGAGRGIPDFKENPSRGAAKHTLTGVAAPSGADGEGASAAESTTSQKFNAQEASEWLAARYQSVLDSYDQQKQSGKKTGDIQVFGTDLSQSAPWAGSKPVIPPKEDFLHQLQMALSSYQGRQADKSG
mmetsp:Transcript_49475/g.87104  ORF Transcript_49475/g.87104 Transcript_49475/m.87104 type:complete len:168 (-) Transcript_49475:189-692(-)